MTDQDWIGRTIDGRYLVESVLGRGGMGVVLRARHTFTGAQVALKVIRAELELDAEVQQRFLAEARAASAIGHPGIVHVADAGKTSDGALYLVMELLEGRTLRHALGTLSADEVRRVLRELLAILAVAHAKGFVHRDLKPDNVFVTASGAVKLLDFGIAKVVDPKTGHIRTATGTTLGTPAYMAPEQLVDASAVDARADLWAVGVIAYELLSGSLPFRGTTHEVLIAIATRDPDPIRAHVGPVAPALEVFFARALARSPRARFTSADEMALAIATLELPRGKGRASPAPAVTAPASWAMSPSVGAHVPAPTPAPAPPPAFAATPVPFAPAAGTPAPAAWTPAPPPTAVVPAARRSPLTWIAIVLAAVMVIGFVAFLSRRGGDTTAGSAAGDGADACVRGCRAAAACGLQPDDCVATCRTDARLAACVELATIDCKRAATCGIAMMCGDVEAAGSESCATTIRCQGECAPGDLACGCRCIPAMHPRHTLALARVDTCAIDCEFEESCIRGQCSTYIQACALE